MSVKDKQTFLELVHCPGHEAMHWPSNAVSAYPHTTYSLIRSFCFRPSA